MYLVLKKHDDVLDRAILYENLLIDKKILEVWIFWLIIFFLVFVYLRVMEKVFNMDPSEKIEIS